MAEDDSDLTVDQLVASHRRKLLEILVTASSTFDVAFPALLDVVLHTKRMCDRLQRGERVSAQEMRGLRDGAGRLEDELLAAQFGLQGALKTFRAQLEAL